MTGGDLYVRFKIFHDNSSKKLDISILFLYNKPIAIPTVKGVPYVHLVKARLVPSFQAHP